MLRRIIFSVLFLLTSVLSTAAHATSDGHDYDDMWHGVPRCAWADEVPPKPRRPRPPSPPRPTSTGGDTGTPTPPVPDTPRDPAPVSGPGCTGDHCDCLGPQGLVSEQACEEAEEPDRYCGGEYFFYHIVERCREDYDEQTCYISEVHTPVVLPCKAQGDRCDVDPAALQEFLLTDIEHETNCNNSCWYWNAAAKRKIHCQSDGDTFPAAPYISPRSVRNECEWIAVEAQDAQWGIEVDKSNCEMQANGYCEGTCSITYSNPYDGCKPQEPVTGTCAQP